MDCRAPLFFCACASCVVHKPERIAKFVPKLDQMVTDGLVTLIKMNVLIYRHNAETGKT